MRNAAVSMDLGALIAAGMLCCNLYLWCCTALRFLHPLLESSFLAA